MKRNVFFTILCLAALVCLLLDSQLRIVVSEYTIESDKLPETFDGFRIVQLSDLHGAEFGRENRRLIRAIQAQKPDMIAVTGDLVDESSGAETMTELMGTLSSHALCCYVTGNHEWAAGNAGGLKNALRSRDVWVLDNRCQLLTRDGEHILLGGVDDPNGPADMVSPPALVNAARQEHAEDFFLLLGHRNDWVEKYPALDVDLLLCGHGHGGLVRLPWVGGLFGSERTVFPEHTAGVFSADSYDMVVSRGLGNSPGTLRLFNNPEIVVIHLKKI